MLMLLILAEVIRIYPVIEEVLLFESLNTETLSFATLSVNFDISVKFCGVTEFFCY